MSKIEWTEQTWNPIAGCSKVSEGCRNCYAEKMAKRLVAMGVDKYAGTVDERGLWTGEILLDEQKLNEPLSRKKPTRYFVNSMSDLFHENVSSETIGRIFNIMVKAHWHTFQILTKRPKRMQAAVTAYYDTFNLPVLRYDNIWLGVSVENQETADERIPLLIQTPAAVRFISAEPLLGPIILPSLKSLSWVIAGGESGPCARPMDPDWARSLRDECQTAGVPFFFKQWGGANKKAAGRLLDGRVWDEIPEVTP